MLEMNSPIVMKTTLCLIWKQTVQKTQYTSGDSIQGYTANLSKQKDNVKGVCSQPWLNHILRNTIVLAANSIQQMKTAVHFQHVQNPRSQQRGRLGGVQSRTQSTEGEQLAQEGNVHCIEEGHKVE